MGNTESEIKIPKKRNINSAKYYSQIKLWRFVMLFFAMIYSFGVYQGFKSYTSALFSFAPPVFFILSGFLVLRESENTEKRIMRTIKRTGLCFLILCVVYVILSLIVNKEMTVSEITQKSFWADFIVFNVWSLPVGSTVWYVQSLLYAYIFIYILKKLNLLKYDIFIALPFLIFAVISGEFSSLFGFKLFWHTYLGGNFATRAIPYVLIGAFIRREKDLLIPKRRFTYLALTVFGFALIIAEYFALSFTEKLYYPGYMIGTAVVSFSLCCTCFFADTDNVRKEYFKGFNRFEMMIPYFVCSPVYGMLIKPIMSGNKKYIGGVPEVLTIVISFAIFCIYVYIKNKVNKKKTKRKGL